MCRIGSLDYWREHKSDILCEKGFMGDASVPPLPKAVQERIEQMVRSSIAD